MSTSHQPPTLERAVAPTLLLARPFLQTGHKTVARQERAGNSWRVGPPKVGAGKLSIFGETGSGETTWGGWV